jgi:hypothetical protein
MGKGTGLGLAVVFGLMQVNNGLIDLKSKLGEGTTLSLFFPLPTGVVVSPNKIKVIPAIRLPDAASSTDSMHKTVPSETIAMEP